MWGMGGQGRRPPQETHNSYHFCRFLSFCSSFTSNTWRLMTGTFTPTGRTHSGGWWRSPLSSWCHCGPSFRCSGQQEPSERSAWNGGFNYLSVGLNGHKLKASHPHFGTCPADYGNNFVLFVPASVCALSPHWRSSQAEENDGRRGNECCTDSWRDTLV